jgi:hypothetical protein
MIWKVGEYLEFILIVSLIKVDLILVIIVNKNQRRRRFRSKISLYFIELEYKRATIELATN